MKSSSCNTAFPNAFSQFYHCDKVQRLLTAGLQLDYERIAEMHESGLTRHGIEHRFRKPRKVAAQIISKYMDNTEVTEVTDTKAEADSKKKKCKANVIAEDVTKPASARKRVAAARRPAARKRVVISRPRASRKASATPDDDALSARSDLAVKGTSTEDTDETVSMPLTEDESMDEGFSATEGTSEA